MAMQPTDKLIAAPRGSLSETLVYFQRLRVVKRWSNFVEYVEAVFAFAPRVGLDPSIAIAQAAHETGNFTSVWWEERLNPAGLGVTGNPRQDAVSPAFLSGIEAARAQLAHLLLYATGRMAFPLMPSDDPRYDAYVEQNGNTPMASTIQELGGANKWAVDSGYGDKVCRHGNAIYPRLSPSSRIEEDDIKVSKGASALRIGGITWSGKEDAEVNGIVLHAERRVVTVGVDKLNVRVYAETKPNSPVLRKLSLGDKVRVIGWVQGRKVDGEDRWWIAADHTRIWVGGTVEKPS